MTESKKRITVFLADDNLIVREGVKTLIGLEDDLDVIGTASDYDELIAGATAAAPQVVVTDIRMPPTFQREGIDAALEIRKRHPGTGIVILSQYDEPAYAVSLLSEGAAGLAYLLKDRVAEGDQLAHAIREVAVGGSVLDPRIADALVSPITSSSELNPSEQDLLRLVAAGKSIKAIAAIRQTTPAMISDAVDQLFLKLANQASSGSTDALKHLKMLHQSIVDLEEQGESLSRLLPGGVAQKLRSGGQKFGESERLVVTVLMSDIRGYSTIAEKVDASVVATQLNEHRSEMSKAIMNVEGNVWAFVGDAVMAVFGAPLPQEDHARRALTAALEMQLVQAEINQQWLAEGLPEFGLGIGISTGEVAAVLLGS
ncbi:MAG: adenylate/guanylate cyclase domain-containing protein, partial [Actinomycetota bacterium]